MGEEGSRNRTNRMCLNIWRKIDFQQLARMTVAADKSKVCRAGRRAADPGGAAVHVQRPSAAEFPLQWETYLFLKAFN